MNARSLLTVVVCSVALWSLRAFACGNAMDDAEPYRTATLGFDMLLWPAGAVFLNRVVLANVEGATAEGETGSSRFRRGFFLLVGACLLLLLTTLMAAAPFQRLGVRELSACSLNLTLLLMMIAFPASVFVLQALFFRGFSESWFGKRRGLEIAALVITSVVLAVVVGLTREGLFLPQLCGPGWYDMVNPTSTVY